MPVGFPGVVKNISHYIPTGAILRVRECQWSNSKKYGEMHHVIPQGSVI